MAPGMMLYNNKNSINISNIFQKGWLNIYVNRSNLMSNNQKFLSMREITGNVYTMSNTLYDRYMSQIPQKNNKHITHTHVCKVGLFIFDYDKTDLVILGTHFMYIHTCLRLLRKKHSAKHTCLWNIHTTYHNDMGPLLILTAQTVFEGSRRFDRYLYSNDCV